MWELGREVARGERGEPSEMTGWHTRKHHGMNVAFCGVLDGVGLGWAGSLERGDSNRGCHTPGCFIRQR